MSGKPLILAIVGATTVAAAAAGGYVAVRLNSADRTSSVATVAGGAPAVTATTPVLLPQPAASAPSPSKDVRKPVAERRDERQSPASGANTLAPVGPGDVKPPAPLSAPPPDPGVTPPAAPVPATVSASGPPIIEAIPPVADTRADTPPASADPSKPLLEEVTVKEDAVIGIRLEAAISTETAKVEDHVSARVARDVMVDGRTAIPSGARLEGTVAVVEHGGKFKDRARIGVRFETLILADNTRVPLRTETIYRNGEAPTGEATSKIGASAVLGAILGRVIGGKKGTAIGSAVGAAGGTAAVMAGGPKEAIIPAGTPLTLRLTGPVTVLIERHLLFDSSTIR